MFPLDSEQAFATRHVLAAFAALLAGAGVFALPKGTHIHRVIGTTYGGALVVVNVAALSLHREHTFGVFHVLAVASPVTIVVGLSPLLLGKRSPPVIATVLSISGVVIFGRVPSTLDRMLAQR